MVIGVLAIAIAFCFAGLAALILSPFIAIWSQAWRHPKQTAGTVVALVAGLLLIVWFDLPWNFGFGFNRVRLSGHDVIGIGAQFLAMSGSLVAPLFVLLLPFIIIGSIVVFVRTALSFARAEPRQFVGQMMFAFLGAFAAYAFTGFVPLTWAVYGIGALILLSCLRSL